MSNTYEKAPEAKPFKSRRKERNTFYSDFTSDGSDWKAEQFAKKIRWSHIRSTTTMPIHMKAVDRHGLVNFESPETKALDRLKLPPILVFGCVCVVLMMISWNLI